MKSGVSRQASVVLVADAVYGETGTLDPLRNLSKLIFLRLSTNAIEGITYKFAAAELFDSLDVASFDRVFLPALNFLRCS
jgi:hypothetical protein